MRSRFASLSLGSFNLALLSFYFFPVWGRGAFRVLFPSYNSLGDHAHTTAAIYFSQLFDLSFKGLLLTSYVLAGVKLVIAAAFVAYVIEFARSCVAGRQPDHETTDVVLILAVVGILLHALPALALGEAAITQLYATQILLIAGAITVIVVERHLAAEPNTWRLATTSSDIDALRLALPVGMWAAGPPPAPTAAALARIPEARMRNPFNHC